ncbi:hypothetical protein GCM10027299_28370 [Larkinella ripae]
MAWITANSWVPVLLIIWVQQPLKAQNPASRAVQDSILEKYATDYLKKEGTVGISIGLVNNGKTAQYHWGETEKGNRTAPDSTTLYSLGSIAKTFAATLLAQAVVDKKCTLRDDIRTYLPDRLDFSNLSYGGKPIQLLHLCNHTARIPSQLANLPANWNTRSPEEKYHYKKNYTAPDFLKDLQHCRIDTLPGTRYDYSNAGVKLLTLIIERLYHRPYAALLEEYGQKEIGLLNTKVFLSPSDWTRFASGSQDKEVLIRTKDRDDFTSGPVLNSTVSDMLRYLTFQMTEKNRVVQLTHQKTWEDSNGIRMGLIWRLGRLTATEDSFFHSGQGWGCMSFCIFSVKRKTGVVVLVNDTTNQKRLIELGKRIFQEVVKGR